MTYNTKKSELATLESHRIALENAQGHEQIKIELAKHGYVEEVLEEGRELLRKATFLYFNKKDKSTDLSDFYDNYTDLRDKLFETYKIHRKKAKIIYDEDQGILEKLLIDNYPTENYAEWLKHVIVFYTQLKENPDLLEPLSRFEVSQADITMALDDIEEVQKAKTIYTRAKGDAEETTKDKNDAIARINNWMSDFYAIAKIALAKDAQLQEALSKFTRN